jgi:hypothetical protein
MKKAAIGFDALRFTRRAAAISAAAILAILLLDRRAVSQQCLGDCNGDGRVTIGELLISVQVELGTAPIDACPVCESVDCVIDAIRNPLQGCPGEPCGAAVCVPPEVCCNPVLGICVSPEAPVCAQ